jgi:anti-sigma B factor antagonist
MPTIQELFQVTSSEPQEHEVRLALQGELDLMTAPVMKDAIDKAASNGYRRMVLDLTELRFIDSTGMHLLVEAQRRMTAKRAETVVTSPPPHVAKVFEVMGLDRVFGLAT